MSFSWSIFIDLGIISIALLIVTLAKTRIGFFDRYLIPNSILAGFLLLPFYSYIGPLISLNTEGLGSLVYHLLNLSFIAMSLRTRRYKTSGKGVFSMVIAILSQYSLQSLLGLGITFLFIFTIIPNLFPSFGLLITLGFALGPGQAFSIGTGWEEYGFYGGGSVGLTFAAIGFLWACFGGIILINRAKQKGWIKKRQGGNPDKTISPGSTQNRNASTQKRLGSVFGSGTIDPLAYNLAVVLGIYLVTFLFLKLITHMLSFAGDVGMDFAEGLWGIAFIFASVIAVGVKKLFFLFGIDATIDNEHLTRIAGTSVDIMVAAAIGAISLVVLVHYWLPITVLAVLGGVITMFSVLWLSSRMFKDHIFYRTILIYGAMTGTLPTGLALLRMIDHDFETPASSDYMYAVGLMFIFAIPFIISMNFPAYGYTTGRSIYYWITFLIYFAYLIFVFIAYRVIAGKGAFKNAGRIWVEK
ncbi:MAG: sodium:glutamate symporter [Spirochaetes bacterium]|nr:sodium:glutamate symporter [Spirochaetota bacterium]